MQLYILNNPQSQHLRGIIVASLRPALQSSSLTLIATQTATRDYRKGQPENPQGHGWILLSEVSQAIIDVTELPPQEALAIIAERPKLFFCFFYLE